jgi:hypothetical protein
MNPWFTCLKLIIASLLLTASVHAANIVPTDIEMPGTQPDEVAGSGDLCIRCHSTGGWYGGRSTPTDGSGLASSDDDGVDCDACHSMANPDNTEHLGVMNSPFIANCSDDPVVPAGTCESAHGPARCIEWDPGWSGGGQSGI